MWGKVVKVEECPCGARSLRWRDAHVGQGREVGGMPIWGPLSRWGDAKAGQG